MRPARPSFVRTSSGYRAARNATDAMDGRKPPAWRTGGSH
jgi:hypothetical protein